MTDSSATSHSAATLDEILSQRRAARNDVVDVDEPTVKLVVFALGQDWFAFAGEQIREILAQAAVFFVPGCPPSLEGVINVRGDIQSVIRLHDLLHLPAGGSGPQGAILLAHTPHISSGIRVDQVIDVIDLPQSRLQPPPATLSSDWRALVTGVTQIQERPVSVLNLEQLLSDYARGQG